jgi:hypothetical protein
MLVHNHSYCFHTENTKLQANMLYDETIRIVIVSYRYARSNTEDKYTLNWDHMRREILNSEFWKFRKPYEM